MPESLPGHPTPLKFKEPQPNSLVIAAAKAILPSWLKRREQLTIKIRAGAEAMRGVRENRRAAILLNHPDRQDPFVVVALARHFRETFYCIAARECFDWDNGWRGWLFQKIGCYSVARGKADFHSVAMTERILREGERKLVVFPEAEITADEQKIHHLQATIFHILLDIEKEVLAAGHATDSRRASRQGKIAHKKEPVVIIPAAIRVKLESDLIAAITPALDKIDLHLNLGKPLKSDNAVQDIFARLAATVDAYLKRVCWAYGLTVPEAGAVEATDRIASAMLDNVDQAMSFDSNATAGTTDRLYAIRNKVGGDQTIKSIAAHPQAFHCAGYARPCLQSDFERIERLIIMERMLAHPRSNIQACRILDFIESELFDKISPKGWQTSTVNIGAPIAVADFVALYTESKEKGVAALINTFKESLQELLKEI